MPRSGQETIVQGAVDQVMARTAKPELMPLLLSKRQAAELLAVSIKQLEVWMREDVIPQETYVRVGEGKGRIRFVRGRLEEWVTSLCEP